MKCPMKVTEDVQGINPGFESPRLVAEQSRSCTHHGKKLPGADGTGQLRSWRCLLGQRQNSTKHENSCNKNIAQAAERQGKTSNAHQIRIHCSDLMERGFVPNGLQSRGLVNIRGRGEF